MPPALAFLFPGPGLAEGRHGHARSHDAYPAARAVFDEADAALGFSLSKLCFEGPEAELTLTANAQPAILTRQHRGAARARGASPTCAAGAVAGHSLGEYRALVAAGALRLADAVRLVHLRGKFMQEAVPAGRGRDGRDPRPRRGRRWRPPAREARRRRGRAAAANLNGGGQVVIAGHKGAVERAMRGWPRRGAPSGASRWR